MSDKLIALVTGANKGIGLQIVRDLAAQGFTVYLGSRSFQRGEQAAQTVDGDVRVVALDVTDASTIATAYERVQSEVGHLDVLVNNAGVSHAGTPGRSLADIVATGRMSEVDVDELRAVFETNVFGVVAVTQAMLPLLRKAPIARIVNVSSGSGSLSLHADPTKPSPRGVRYLFGFEDRAECRHARLLNRPGEERDHRPRRVPRLYRNGPQQSRGSGFRRGCCSGARAVGPPWR